ncbi:FecCD family ABC transporter permease [Dendrosporobacter sp. 1207_IL3150]|uniref:FecCD family ABC transporter permease n=1 Tax=Dendrosporobacter sp. 1207_IL3150 TaxID=3084054 RepID=UPI002FDB6FBF
MLQDNVNYRIPFEQNNKSYMFGMSGLFIFFLLSILFAVCIGTVNIQPEKAYQIILYKLFHLSFGDNLKQIPLTHFDIIWQIRFPRVLMAVIVGVGLALCGTVMQSSVQNPLADPYILGISAGASLGATLSILLSSYGIFSEFGTSFWAFAGALAASFLVMILSGIGGKSSAVKMILSGIIANALFSAFTSFIIYMANNAEGIRTVTFWTMGSLASAKWSNLTLPAIGVVGCTLFFLSQARNLNTMLLGEEAATTLGVDLIKLRRNNIIVTALLTGLIVASCGIIGFVGLIIPHIVRGFVGSDHRKLLPAAILSGALFLTWADVLARTALSSGELPIGIITALIGAPFLMHIMIKSAFGFGDK